MENLNLRKLNYKKEKFYSDLCLYIYYGICRINNTEVDELTTALKELGLDNFEIDKDVNNKVFIIAAKQQ